MNAYTDLARKALLENLERYRFLKPPKDLPFEMLTKRAGVFVFLYHKDGSLRGSIGTYLPTQKNIAEEIIKNTLSSASRDPRFQPISLKEIPDLIISVDVLSELRPIPNNFPLNPLVYGLIVATADGRHGLILPNIEGVETPEEQIKICKMKAGIFEDEPVTLQVFTVERHKE